MSERTILDNQRILLKLHKTMAWYLAMAGFALVVALSQVAHARNVLGATSSLSFSVNRFDQMASLTHVRENEVSLTESTLVELTNKERGKQGLASLSSNITLTAAAQDKAHDMIAHQYFSHKSPDGKTPWDFIRARYDYIVAGENLAIDFTSARGVMSAWMQSPTHRANILGMQYQDVGIAVAEGAIDGRRTYVIVQLFGQSAQTYEHMLTATIAKERGVTVENIDANDVEFLSSLPPSDAHDAQKTANPKRSSCAYVSSPDQRLFESALDSRARGFELLPTRQNFVCVR